MTMGSYDANGNPCSYRGASLSWEKGGRLKSYTQGIYSSLSYKYDAQGFRQEKWHNGNLAASYYTHEGRLMREKRGVAQDDILDYYYDASGICGLNRNGKSYYFQKNLQGDIIRILDSNGRVTAKYVYDAWGNHRIYAKIDSAYIDITDDISYNDHIGKVNPYRYRGYYYDRENGLYYLQNRYYDPVTRRFISADSPAAAINDQSGAFGGLNPCSYCLNDPVNHTDPTGRSVSLGWAIFWLIVSLISLGVAVYGLSQSVAAFNKEPSWGNLLSVALSVVGVIASVISVVASVKAVVSAAKAVSLIRASQNAVPTAKMGKSTNVPSSNTTVRTIETKAPTTIKAEKVVDAWDEFLGSTQHDINPLTGQKSLDRIFSGDNLRSIRFSSHEMRSLSTPKAHFHFETWVYDSGTDTMTIYNVLQRIQWK